jgi:ketosteroid isomerase-like protein
VARFAALICLLSLLAGCGGDDKKDAEQTVRDFVKAVNERDADAYCDDLITEEFREKSTFATGDQASESCKRQLKAIKGLHIDLVRIVRTKVDGDKAKMTVVFSRSDQRVRQQIQLEKDGGDWKIAGGTG